MPKAGEKRPGVKTKRLPKNYKLADTFPPGEVLRDVFKKQWKLGSVIGQGGFGLIYMASDDITSPVHSTAEYVVKIEPKANGPLFCELHFYQRCCKQEMVESWVKSRKFRYLGVPKYIGAGQHIWNGKEFRFMVIPRYSSDIQKLFEAVRVFPSKGVLCLGLRMLDCLEYLHENGYVHADIKAANILRGYKNGKVMENEVYLVDYGLAFRYMVEGNHKEYKEDPKRVHDGTIEFTSRDAHLGVCPSRRGDLEILGYCLLQWLCGSLPWEDNLMDKNYVKKSKIRYMRNIPSLLKACSVMGEGADAVSSYLSHIVKLDYEEKPNYNTLRQVLKRGLTKLGVKDEWSLDLPSAPMAGGSVQPAVSKAKKRKISSDQASDACPKKKASTSKIVKNGHGSSSLAGVVSPKVATPRSATSIPKLKAATSNSTTPKPTTPKPKAQKNSRSKSRLKKSPTAQSPTSKKTTTRRIRRKKVAAVDVSIQTTPSLSRKKSSK